MPAENRVGLDDRRHFLQSLLAQPLAEHGEGLGLAITQPEATVELVAEDAVFRHQIFIAQQQFLIDCPSDIWFFGNLRYSRLCSYIIDL